MVLVSPWDRQQLMKKIAVIEEIHNDGLDLLEKNSEYEYELITNVSKDNLIKKLPEFDGCTLRISKLDESILKHCPNLKVISRHGRSEERRVGKECRSRWSPYH